MFLHVRHNCHLTRAFITFFISFLFNLIMEAFYYQYSDPG
jgi:hypothetical protein